ncbi:MAG TPA: hypothetical protein VMV69_24025 [Pirellulales bacterium]|nr:hypothetical protein [Pirellulales bacterium]
MKYFTPELYVRLQRLDPRVMDAADAQWEQAGERYERRLKSIRSKLPPSALAMLGQTRLHDAEVLWIGHALPFFAILLRLDAAPRTTIGLNYFVVEPARFDEGTIPAEFCGSPMQWMYDEIDLGAEAHSFKHSILFSNGCHLELAAREVHVANFDTVYSGSNGGVVVSS